MAGRTLHVKCTTWEQVEVFHTRKLRRGKLLSMKVPFQTTLGAALTLGLELPNEVVIAIEGTVHKASPIEGLDSSGKPETGKTWIELELHGFTDEVIARIKAMAAGEVVAPQPAPAKPAPGPPKRPSRAPTDELPADERQLFQHLTAELRRMRQIAVHEVLGVDRDADAEAIRRGWMTLVRRHHPDLIARRNAPAITHLAEELTILCNRAYDRLRVALVTEGRGTAVGAAVRPPPGWLVGFEDLASVEAHNLPRNGAKAATVPPVNVTAVNAASPSTTQGGEAFESRARAMLGDGDADNAQEVLAAALCVYPRSRPLRSLYYVASAIAALGKGEVMLATSQLETALAHYEQCTEAAEILEVLRKKGAPDHDAMRRLFR